MLPRWFRVALSIAILAFVSIPGEGRQVYSWPVDMVFKPVQLDNRQWGFDTGQATGPWGVTDSHGTYQVAPLFDKVAIFIGGFAPIKMNGLWGFIDTTAATVVRPQFDAIWQPSWSQPFRLVFTEDGEDARDVAEIDVDADWSAGFAPGIFPVRVGKYWGVIDSSGTWLTRPDLDKITPIKEGRALFSQEGKYGFLDTTGKIVIKPVFEDMGRFGDGLAPFKLGNTWGYINPDGKTVITPQFTIASDFERGTAMVRVGALAGIIASDASWKLPAAFSAIETGFATGVFRTERDFHYGLYSPVTGEIASPVYDFISVTKGGLIKVSLDFRSGLLDERGHPLLPCSFDELLVDGGNLIRLRKDGQWGVFDLARRRLSSFQFEQIRPFANGLAAVAVKGRWGYVDHNGEMVIPAQYSWVGDFGATQAAVLTATACIVIDRQGQQVSRPVMDWVTHQRPLPDGSRYVRLNTLYGFLLPDGTFSIPPRLEMARWFPDTGVVLGKEANKTWRVFLKNAGEQPSERFTDVGNIKEDLCWFETPQGKAGFIDRHGKIAIKPVFDQAWDFSSGRAGVRRGGKWGFIDYDGKEVIPLEYDSIKSFDPDEEFVKAQRGNLRGTLDREGHFEPLETPSAPGTMRKAFPKPERQLPFCYPPEKQR